MICQPVHQVFVMLESENGDYLSVYPCAEKTSFLIRIYMPCMRPAHNASATMHDCVFRGQVASSLWMCPADNETDVIETTLRSVMSLDTDQVRQF